MFETTLLMYTHPDIAAEWHPSNTLHIEEVTYGSDYKAFWLCSECEQTWSGTVWNRSSGSIRCPYCSGRKAIPGISDIYTLWPDLANELHPTRNDAALLKELVAHSSKKIWWICPIGHEWDCSVVNRTKKGQDCAYCSGKRILAGYNDLETLAPIVAAEWHPTKNGQLLASEVGAKTSRRAWWLGKCGHSWETSIASRVNTGVGCPYCAKKKILVGFNDLLTTHPEEALYWHPTKNVLAPTDVTSGTPVKVWWLGKCGHSWEMLIPNRIRNKQGCPICVGQKVLAGFNDVATTHPWILIEWHPTKNCVTPTEIGAGSERKIWWQCQKNKNHVWQANLRNRIALKRGCPVCANRIIVIGDNDLPTINPELASQWHPTKNSKPATTYGAGSAVKAWWLCSKGHEWEAKIVNRHLLGRDCPDCCKQGTSKSEKAFRDYFTLQLQEVNQSHSSRTLVQGKKYQIDITGTYQESLVAIEYDGSYYHSEPKRVKFDIQKTQALLDAGYLVVRIRENKLPHLALGADNLLQLSHNFSYEHKDIQVTGELILDWLKEVAKS